MATATTELVEIAPAVPAVEEVRVTLVLSEAEAKVLAALYAKTGGNLAYSPRKHVESIGVALAEAGYTYYAQENQAHKLLSHDTFIYFNEGEI